MFESKRDKIRKFLKGKDWQTIEEISIGADMGKTKTKQTLSSLKKEVEFQDDKYRLIVSPNIPEQDQIEVVAPNNSPSVPAQVFSQAEPEIELPEQEPETQKQGLNAKMVQIDQKLDLALGIKQKKEKKGKLKRFSIGKLKRFNRNKNRAVILMGGDQSLRLIKAEYIQGNIAMIRIAENYYEGTVRFVWLWEGKQPVYIIPQWSIRPLAAEEVYQRAKADGTLIDSQIINLRAVKLLELDKEDFQSGKKPNIMLWIGMGVVGLVVAWIFFGGKK